MKKNARMGTGNEVLIRISIIIMFLTSIANVCKCNSCPATTPTVKKVDSCPTTEQEWIAASNKKKCYNLADYKNCEKMLEYHCLLNEWWNETLEVCAPPWFMSGFCPMFNTAEQRVIDNFKVDCSKFTNETCPTRYLSTEAYKYQMCYKKNVTSKTFLNTIKPDEIRQSEVTSSTNILLIILVVIFGIGSLVLSALLWLALIGKIGKGGNVRANDPEGVADNAENQTNAIQSNLGNGKQCSTEFVCNDEEVNEKDRLLGKKHKDIQIDEKRGSPEMKGKSETKDEANDPGIEKGLSPADAKAKIQKEITHLKKQKRVTGSKSDRTEIQRNLGQERKGKKTDEPIIPKTSRPDLEKDTDFATARTQIGEISDTIENTTNPNNLGQCLANDDGTIATKEINQESDMQNVGKTEEDRKNSTVDASDGIGNSGSIQNLPEDQEDEGDNQLASTAPGNIMYSRKENEVDETEVKEKELQNPPINEVLKTGTEMKTSDGNRRNPEQETDGQA